MSEQTKHTPGPWSFDHDWHRLPTIYAADGKTIVAIIEKGTCSRDSKPSPDRIANAHIISAAPEMLDLVKLFEQVVDYEIRLLGDTEGVAFRTATLTRVRAAIAKATGSTT